MKNTNEQIIMTLNEIKETLKIEQTDKTVKKDKKQVNNYLIKVIEHFNNKGINPLVLFEKTNTNRKNSKNTNALRFNSGSLFEILLNIAVDYKNNNLKDDYIKKPLGVADININNINYEIKLVSKYSLSAPKKNHIQNMLVGIINDDGFIIKEIPTCVIEWHYCKETHKDGTIGKKRQVALKQPYGLVRNDLMNLLGI